MNGKSMPADKMSAGYADYRSDVYADDAHRLCKPGIAAEWGMHLIDANAAMGNIEDLAAQAEAYAGGG